MNNKESIQDLYLREKVFYKLYFSLSLITFISLAVVSLNYLISNYDLVYPMTDTDFIGALIGCVGMYILLSIIYLKAKFKIQKEIKKKIELSNNGWVHHDFK